MVLPVPVTVSWILEENLRCFTDKVLRSTLRQSLH